MCASSGRNRINVLGVSLQQQFLWGLDLIGSGAVGVIKGELIGEGPARRQSLPLEPLHVVRVHLDAVAARIGDKGAGGEPTV